MTSPRTFGPGERKQAGSGVLITHYTLTYASSFSTSRSTTSKSW